MATWIGFCMGLPTTPRDDARLQALYLHLDVLNKITQAVKEFISGVLLYCQLSMWLHRGTLAWCFTQNRAQGSFHGAQALSDRPPFLSGSSPIPLPCSLWSRCAGFLASLQTCIELPPGHSPCLAHPSTSSAPDRL